MKETYYFSHDYNVRTDEKIKGLIRKHGMEGYGVYWSIIEDLYNNANALRTDYEGIAYDLRVHINIVESVIKDFELFQINEDYFGSISISKRLDKRLEKSEKARESAKKRWEKDANAMRPHSDSNAIKERKGKERKEYNIDFDLLLEYYNKTYGRKVKTITPKTKKQIIDRLQEGYTKEDLKQAILNAKKDPYHIENKFKYITLEFISRSDKFERFSQIHNFEIQRKLI